MSKSPFLVVHHFVFPCVFVKSSGNLPEAFRLKFDAVVFVETQLYQVVCPKAYVLAEVLFSLVFCVLCFVFQVRFNQKSLNVLVSQKCINTHKNSCLQSGAWLKIVASVLGV